MATRPVFMSLDTGPKLVRTINVEFKWYPGLAKSQKQLSIRSLHQAIREDLPSARILEISSASTNSLGDKLSAFNLTFDTINRTREIVVECAFQSAKVFERGGPYVDLMGVQPIEAKRDPRLQSSGRLIGFRFSGTDWGLTPPTAFYDWLYINALCRRQELAQAVMEYDTFTDIAFNPEKSVNCQAAAAALFVSLSRRGLLEDALRSKADYLRIVSGENGLGVREEDGSQPQLF